MFAAGAQFDGLHLGYLSAFHSESQQGSNQMPSVVAARARVHVKQSERLVAHHFQDVGVAADEQARPQSTDFHPGATVVVPGIAANVRNIYAEAFALPGQIQREFSAQLRAVDVPVDSAQSLKASQSIQHFRRPEISGVPYLIAFREVFEDSVIQKTMRV